MADGVNLIREAEKGSRARILLESEPYKDAIGKVRQGIYDKWAASPVLDKDGQHALRLMLKLLDDLEGNIKEAATTGKLASLQIEQQREQESRMKRVIKGIFR
jgi:hypothetical protein